MVVDTTYYDLLQLLPQATALDIKKAYRKAAIKLHPDKNPDDPGAAARFQEVGEAYQVLSDERLREKYDKYGKQESIPTEGFEDPTEFFAMIFGGEAFKDWIGELSLLKEMSKTAELSGAAEEEKKEDEKKVDESKVGKTEPSSALDIHHEIPQSSGSKSKLYLENQSSTLTKEEREAERRKQELADFEKECEENKIKTRQELLEKLINKLSLFTETDMADDISDSFRRKIVEDAELLKMESFGLEILHTLGNIYKTKAKIVLKSQSFLGGLGGFWWTIKEKGGVLRDTFNTVSAALDAQLTMEEYSKMQQDNEYHAKKEAEEAEAERQKAQAEVDALEEQLHKILLQQKKQEAEQEAAANSEKEGDDTKDVEKKEEKIPEKHTAEDLQDMEKYLMGKVLAAAWNGSKFEIQGTVRAVCDQVLYEEGLPLEKRVARAKGLLIIGRVFYGTTRSEDEAEEARVFEELVAEASQKRRKRGPQPETEVKEHAA